MYERNGRFPVNDGDLFFEWAGAGEAVVFLHGFGLDSRMWAPQFELLQSTFRVIRYDLRGFGRSSLPPHTGYAHEDDLNALLSNIGAAPAMSLAFRWEGGWLCALRQRIHSRFALWFWPIALWMVMVGLPTGRRTGTEYAKPQEPASLRMQSVDGWSIPLRFGTR